MKLSYVMSIPHCGHTIYIFFQICYIVIWLYDMVYYEIVEICKDLPFQINFDKWNKVSISESVADKVNMSRLIWIS